MMEVFVCGQLLTQTFTLLTLFPCVSSLGKKRGGGDGLGGIMNAPVFPSVTMKDVD